MPVLTPPWPEGAAAPDGTVVPLTYEQQRYLARTRDGSWVTKNVRLSYEILGDFDALLFAEAVRAFVARHDALHLRLVPGADGAQAQQVRSVAADERFVEFQSVTSASAEQFSRYASALLSRDFVEPWDGQRRPFALRLLRRDEQHHAFLANFPNLVFDGRAHQLFAREIWRDYQALRQGEAVPSAAPSFAAAALRQRTRSGPQQVLRARQSWRERLGFVARNPWHRPPGATASEDGVIEAEIAGDVVDALRRACERERCTVLQGVVGCFVQAVAERAGQRRVGLWTTMDSRLSREHDVVGMLAGSSPLMVREPAADRRAVLREVQGQFLDALRHHQVTAADVAELSLEAEAEAGAPVGKDVYLNLRRFDGVRQGSRLDGPLRVTADAYPLRRINVTNSSALQLRCDEHRDAVVIELVFDGARVGRPLAQAITDRMVADLTTWARSAAGHS